MTRSNTISKPESYPFNFPGKSRNESFSSRSPTFLNQSDTSTQSFLQVMHLTCDYNTSLSTNLKPISLTDSEKRITHPSFNCEKRSPFNGFLTKYWKSTSVLCEKENSDLAGHKPRKSQPRKKSLVRSCERGSRIEETAAVPVAQNDRLRVNGESAVESKDVVANKEVTVCWNAAHTPENITSVVLPKLNGCFSTHTSDTWSDSIGSDCGTTNNKAHSPCEVLSDSFMEKQHIANNESVCPVPTQVHQSPTSRQQHNGIVETASDENEADSNEDRWSADEFKGDADSMIQQPEEEEELNSEDANKTNLIVNYLPQSMTQEEIHSLFSTVGEVDSCKLIKDKNTNQNLGYGFVNYAKAKDAERAISVLNGMQLQNKTIKVSLARPSSESIKGANLYISGLPQAMTQAQLEKLFNQCGRIITSRILYDSTTGLSRGVGFIRFDQRSEAELAIKQLNGHVPDDGTDPITVKLANSPASGNASTNPYLTMNNHCLNRHLVEVGRPPHLFLNSAGKPGVDSGKPNSTALAMMLLQQMASQTSACSNRFPRSNAAALLPFPTEYNPTRAHRPAHNNNNNSNHASTHFSKRVPSLHNSVLGYHQQQQQPATGKFLDQDPHTRRPTTIPFSLPVANAFPSSHGIFDNQPQLLNAQLVYPRYRYPPHNRMVGMPTAQNGVAMNGLTATQSTIPTISPLIPLTTYPVAEFPNLLSSDAFLPYHTPHTMPTSTPHGLAYGEMGNFTYPLGFGTANSAVAPVITPVTGYPVLPPSFPQSAPVVNSISSPTGLFCLFVSNLPPETDDSTLWRLFGPYGAVRSVKVIREAGTNKCKGFGFVNMVNYVEAVWAIQQLNNYSLGNRLLHVTFKNQSGSSQFQP